MTHIKLTLSTVIVIFLLTSCFPERREFVYHLSEIDTYMCISKRKGGTCYIIFSENLDTLLESDSIDYIKVSNIDNDIFIVYDTINKKKLYICCGLQGVSQSVKYNIKLFHPPEWNKFDSIFYEERKTQFRKFKEGYFYVKAELQEFRVYHNGKVIKEGNLFGD